jgi:ribose/xylose/arabinose/galactoside ABC-type transport system permease subunit
MSSMGTAPAAGISQAVASKKLGRRLLDAGLLIFAAVVMITFSLTSKYFLTPGNWINILLSVSIIGIIGVAMTLVIVSGGIDLSAASTMALVGSIQGVMVMKQGHPWWVALLVSLAVGLIIGLFNALVVTRLKIAPFIVTLAMSNIVRGAAYIYTTGNAIFLQSPRLEWFGVGRVLGIPVPVLLMLGAYLGMWAALRYTVFGRYVYAVGGNPVAARLAGINTDRYLTGVFAFSGLAAAVAGTVLTGLTATAMPSVGVGYELDVVTAVLLGGASLRGGEGSIWGTLFGVMIIGVLNNGMALLSVPPFWQILAKGVLLLGAVSLDALRKR